MCIFSVTCVGHLENCYRKIPGHHVIGDVHEACSEDRMIIRFASLSVAQLSLHSVRECCFALRCHVRGVHSLAQLSSLSCKEWLPRHVAEVRNVCAADSPPSVHHSLLLTFSENNDIAGRRDGYGIVIFYEIIAIDALHHTFVGRTFKGDRLIKYTIIMLHT